MIFLYMGLFFLGLWYIADKGLGKKFISYLKWSSLLMIGLLIAVDLYFFVETERFLTAREAGGDLGLGYSYFNNDTNLTVETVMYGKQTVDSGTVMAYHYAESGMMELLVQMLPEFAIFLGSVFILQYVYLLYMSVMHPGQEEPDEA
jgi:hypothetical protein